MDIFTHPEFSNHEQVSFVYDAASGLRAIIAVHDTRRGPALGGCRMWTFADEAAALTDVLRLSRGMTYKAALAELPFGGGKSVIIGDPAADKSEALFEAMGAAVERLGGWYVVAEDVGISVADVEIMARRSTHVAGTPTSGSGDPSPATAWGVFQGIRAACRHRFGSDDLDGCHVAVQGLGHVGAELCRLLVEAGARLTVTDISAERMGEIATRHGAEFAAAEDIHKVAADVFAPCALGGVLNDATIPELGAPIVAGSANNQLAEPRHGDMLAVRDVLYAPDYAINAGGIINIAHERGGYDREAAFAHVARIGETLTRIFEIAAAEAMSTAAAADRLAEERLEGGGGPGARDAA
jgi:leucine dehydrogenase